MRRLRSVEAEASATMHTNFRSVCSMKGIRRIRPGGHPYKLQRSVISQAPPPQFQKQEVKFS